MSEEKGVFAAGIVLYNPQIEKLAKVISSVINQVELLILVDNCSNNISDILQIQQEFQRIEIIENSCNEGIAKGLNQIVRMCKQHGYKWVLTLDQDSVVDGNLIKTYEPYIYMDKIGQITCLIEDVNIGVMHGRGFVEEYRYVERCITSGSLVNVNACISVGLFDECMFIDYVDFDMSFSLRENGYKILQINYCGLFHEMGVSLVKNIGGKQIIITQHDSLNRYYYFARNLVYCIRKHSGKNSLSKSKYIIKLVGRLGTIILFEKNRWNKVKQYIKGLYLGLKMKVKK